MTSECVVDLERETRELRDVVRRMGRVLRTLPTELQFLALTRVLKEHVTQRAEAILLGLAVLLGAHVAEAVPIMQSEIYIYNVEGTTDYPFAIVEGAAHHAYEWDVANGSTLENASYDWIPLGEYVCLAGQRCIVGGEGLRLVDIANVTLTSPTIDMWGHPTPVPTPEPATWWLLAPAAGMLIAAHALHRIKE